LAIIAIFFNTYYHFINLLESVDIWSLERSPFQKELNWISISQVNQISNPIIIPKKCACGCNTLFTPTNNGQKYLNKQHRDRAYARRYRKNHNVHKEYQGKFYCPMCGELGQLFFLFRDNSVLMSVIIEHRKREYSKLKRKALRKKGLTSKQICNKNVGIKKSVRDCYLS